MEIISLGIGELVTDHLVDLMKLKINFSSSEQW